MTDILQGLADGTAVIAGRPDLIFVVTKVDLLGGNRAKVTAEASPSSTFSSAYCMTWETSALDSPPVGRKIGVTLSLITEGPDDP